MTIKDALTPERIIFLEYGTRADVIKALVPYIASEPGMPGPVELEAAFLQREEMMSTGIGMGIGVPHVRLHGIESLVMALAVHKNGISDYPAIDHQPVRIVAMIAAGPSQHGDYIKTLANVVSALKSESARNAILTTDSAQEIYDILCEG